MEPKTVKKLEEKIEQAVAEIIAKMGTKKHPLLPCGKPSCLRAADLHRMFTVERKSF
jgi:hypothetical protein